MILWEIWSFQNSQSMQKYTKHLKQSIDRNIYYIKEISI